MDGNWKFVDKFVHWCLVSDDEIGRFYKTFFRSNEFADSFHPDLVMAVYRSMPPPPPVAINFLEKWTEDLASLIKLINLRTVYDHIEIMRKACQVIFLKCYVSYFCDLRMNKSEVLFKTVDRFLLAFLNDQTCLIGLKKKLFTDKAKKLYV